MTVSLPPYGTVVWVRGESSPYIALGSDPGESGRVRCMPFEWLSDTEPKARYFAVNDVTPLAVTRTPSNGPAPAPAPAVGSDEWWELVQWFMEARRSYDWPQVRAALDASLERDRPEHPRLRLPMAGGEGIPSPLPSPSVAHDDDDDDPAPNITLTVEERKVWQVAYPRALARPEHDESPYESRDDLEFWAASDRAGEAGHAGYRALLTDLARFAEWVDTASDGWAYWSVPRRATAAAINRAAEWIHLESRSQGRPIRSLSRREARDLMRGAVALLVDSWVDPRNVFPYLDYPGTE